MNNNINASIESILLLKIDNPINSFYDITKKLKELALKIQNDKKQDIFLNSKLLLQLIDFLEKYITQLYNKKSNSNKYVFDLATSYNNTTKKMIDVIKQKMINLESNLDISKLKEKIKNLENKLTSLGNENKALKDENKNIKNKIISLENNYKALEKDNQELKKDNQELKKDNQELKKDNQELKKDNQELKKDNQELKKDNQELKDDNNNIKTKMENLENKLNWISNFCKKIEIDLEQIKNRDNYKSIIYIILIYYGVNFFDIGGNIRKSIENKIKDSKLNLALIGIHNKMKNSSKLAHENLQNEIFKKLFPELNEFGFNINDKIINDMKDAIFDFENNKDVKLDKKFCKNLQQLKENIKKIK
jgi:chromosome segregation ATPase